MPTRDENVVERPIVPYNPAQANVRNRDVYNLYAPTAGPNKVGMAGFNPDDFVINDQIVSLAPSLKSANVRKVNVAEGAKIPDDITYGLNDVKTPNCLYYNYTNEVLRYKDLEENIGELITVTGGVIVVDSEYDDNGDNLELTQTEIFIAEGHVYYRSI